MPYKVVCNPFISIFILLTNIMLTFDAPTSIFSRHFQMLFLPLTLYVLMDSSVSFDTLNFEWSFVYIEGSQVLISI